MKTPPQAEEKLIEVFTGVVAKDSDRVGAAIRAFNEEELKTATATALFICGYVVNDVFRDGPTPENLHEMAEQIIEDLTDLVNLGEVDDVAKFLDLTARGSESLEGLSPMEVLFLAFPCAGYLLAAFSLEDQRWWEYLDEIMSSEGEG